MFQGWPQQRDFQEEPVTLTSSLTSEREPVNVMLASECAGRVLTPSLSQHQPRLQKRRRSWPGADSMQELLPTDQLQLLHPQLCLQQGAGLDPGVLRSGCTGAKQPLHRSGQRSPAGAAPAAQAAPGQGRVIKVVRAALSVNPSR